MASFLKIQRKKILGLLILVALSLPFSVSAAGLEQAGGSSLCDKMAEGTGGFFSCGQDQTTLTDFKGGLTTPDASGYTAGLTQATNVRDYIKNIVNFALGFLGILAVVIIIYGGFLYVAAAGAEEQATKGKKAIQYALIGILIILASFAIVNTILQAPSGKENQTLNGAAPSVTSIADQAARRRAFFNQAASVVQTVARDFVTAYQNYSEIKTDIDVLKNVDAEKDVKSASDLKSILQSKKNILININTKAGALSQVSEKTKAALVVLDSYIQLSDKKMVDDADNIENTKNNGGGVNWQAIFNTDFSNFQNSINDATGENGLQGANEQDFVLAIKSAEKKLTDLYIRVHAAGGVPEVEDAFHQVFVNLNLLAPITNPVSAKMALNKFSSLFVQLAHADNGSALVASAANNETILKIVNSMGILYEKVKDIQFVYAAINADVVEGNQPLVVSFDGLKSRDPNNHTLPGNNFQWDFGDPGDCNQDPVKTTGITAKYTFCKPGTYIVKLLITAPPIDQANGETQKTADGVAYQTITVRPPSSRINLNATVNGKDFVLSQFDPTGFQLKNIQDLTLTTTEAKSGFVLDASKTETGEGKSFQSLPKTSMAKVKWDFGDKMSLKNVVEGPPDTISQTQKVFYNTEGAYRITLEVTDDRGVTDRKIINAIVNSLAARITIQPGNKVHLGDEVAFDASSSASDSGQIKTYEWQIMKTSDANTPAKDVTPATLKNNDSFKFKFTEPGHYNVQLTVNDGSKDASTSVEIAVESKPPVAQIVFDNPDKTQPNTYIFDASRSYDPDGKEDLAYKWEINAAPGECTLIDGANRIDCLNAFKDYSLDKKFIKPKLKFKIGKYTIGLDVQDPAEPGKGIHAEKELVVDNDLDVGWGDDGKPKTAKIKDGSAEVSFSITSTTATTYEIDTGDGKKESGNMTTNPITVKHIYTRAGIFEAKLTVFDAMDNENSTTRKIFVAASDEPISAIALNIDGENIFNTSETMVVSRKTAIVFDAGKSMNVDGTGRKLLYFWDFGDGEKSSKKQVTHTYKELTSKDAKNYKVTLKVANEDNPAQVSQIDEVHINVVSLPPVIRGITAAPDKTDLITPVTVTLNANAIDPDGKIITYKWSYYDVDAPDEELGLQITQAPNTTIVIGTRGDEGVKKTYGFSLTVSDDENKTASTLDQVNPETLPAITVTNGVNKAPKAQFSVDRTSMTVNEPLNFSSSSVDSNPGGSIAKYIWDFNGNGFADEALNNDYNKPNVTYTYTKPYDGVRVRLKVINNNGAEAVSDPITIYVDAVALPPVAAFTSKQLNGKKIQFTNNSTFDTVAGAKNGGQTWDFDLKADSNGDGILDNDLDSADENPVHEYAEYGVYRAKLSIKDDQGNKTSITNFVNVKAPTLVTPPPTTPSEILEARLTSLPVANIADGRIHLQGDKGTVIFNFSDSKGFPKLYTIDKNIYFDSNGNGTRDDDSDYETTTPGTWTTQFARTDGQTRIRLTVKDAEGKKNSVEKDIVFDAVPPAPVQGKTKSLMGI